ncbi:MAG: TPM domain-containing protein [Oscillospiraceae bacterium]|nr:TPM domain-containing protein [Oscillospiraceae bacterium]
MKKRFLKLSALLMAFAVVFGIFAATAYADATKQYVYDSAYLLNDDEYYELNELAYNVSEQYGCAVHFIITDDPTINLDNIQLYSEDLYLDSDALGYGQGKDGVMLVLGTYDRCYWLLAYGSKGNYAFTDYAKDWMSDRFVAEFAEDDWYEGFKTYIEDCEYVLGEAEKGTPVDIYYGDDMGTEAYAIAFIIGIIIALVVCFIFKAQMKPAKLATRASEYIDRQGVKITHRNQIFRYSTVTRTKIESDNHSSSGSSRGGTTVNSRGFSGKGGRF